VNDCLFCQIAAGAVPAVVLHEDVDLMAFLDTGPIRAGHTQIIPKTHVESFDLLPSALAAKIVTLGQHLAQRMKAVFEVERVAFVFTGGDVPHAHAHLVPMHAKTDITSARYIVAPGHVQWDSAHLRVDPEELVRVKDALAFSANQ